MTECMFFIFHLHLTIMNLW